MISGRLAPQTKPMQNSKNDIYAQVKKSGNLPTLPEILLKLLRACDDENIPLTEIAEIISRDPGLSFRVLQLVNSAYYGFRYTFTGIEQAVVYLGSAAIKNLAVTLSVQQVFAGKRFNQRFSQFTTEEFWFHSLLCATIAKRLASKTGVSSPDEAYLSGLLHDIGKLLLVATFPETYEQLAVENNERQVDVAGETEKIGANHCEAGSWLIRTWKLNSFIADAVLYHHDPVEQVNEAFPLVKVVYMANRMARSTTESGQLDEAASLLLRLEGKDLAEIIDGAAEEVEQIAERMGIKLFPLNRERGSKIPSLSAVAVESTVDSSASEEADERTSGAAEKDILARIENVSLLTSFLEQIVQADELDAILAAFEQSLNILFGIENVLVFLADHEAVLLTGHASLKNRFHEMSRGLTLSARQSSSVIVQTYRDMLSAGYLHLTEDAGNLADQQILAIYACPKALAIPLVADKKPLGAVVLGLPPGCDVLSENDLQLVRTLVQQMALRLFLENTKRLKAEQLQMERMAAVSMAAKKFAHEINNPLGIISNYLVTMKLKLSGEHEVLDELTIIDEEIQRISTMVSQMEMFSQTPFAGFESISINEVIRDIVQLANSSLFIHPNIKISFIPGSDLHPIRTSKDAIKQILINLLKNSVEAMDNSGRVVVRTRKTAGEDGLSQEAVEIIVADTGPGLPEAVSANLYQPFVTTKENGHSGLGLSIVQKTVKDIGGKLSCSSSKEGTTFTIYLPAIASSGMV